MGMQVNSNPEMFVGVTLQSSDCYLGDDVGFKGCYYWDEVKQEVCNHTVDNMHVIRVAVDATPEVVEKAEQFMKIKLHGMIRDCIEIINADRAKTLYVEDRVRVTGGRKVKKGTVGTLSWLGQTQYGTTALVRFGDAKDPNTGRWKDAQFIQPRFLELINPPTLSLTPEETELLARDIVRSGSWDRLGYVVKDRVADALRNQGV